MSGEGEEQEQAGYEDSGPGGPGAPTPLSALEVCHAQSCEPYPGPKTDAQ